MNLSPKYLLLQEPTPEVFELLKKTTYGTKGIQIVHRDTDKKLNELHLPDFHTLWVGTQLAAVAVYCKRVTINNQKKYNSYYIRYFSVDPMFQNKGFGKLLTEKAETFYRKNINEKTIFYAYIENQNFKSLNVSNRFEMTKTGNFQTIFFSRLFPKPSNRCKKATKQELQNIKNEIKEQHQQHNTVFTHRIGYEGQYYIFQENGETIAGAQAILTKWKMKRIPGIVGWLTLNIFPSIPILNRIANGKDFQFIGIEGVFCKTGRTPALIELLEHILANNKQYKCFLYFDTKEKLFLQELNQSKLGILQKIQKSPTVSINIQSLFLEKEEIEILKNNPMYISAYDIT